MRILFVSPSHPEANWLSKALQECAHSLCRANVLNDAADEAERERFDAVILMVNDPARYAQMESVLPQVCAASGGAIVFAVLADATAHERARILRAGADACFARPFSFVEMHERLQALRRVTLVNAALMGQPVAAPLQLDAVTRELVSGGQRLPLTKREYLLLECLMREPDAPVTHDQLIRYAWPEKDRIDFGSVSPLVWRLRCKLKKHLPSVRISTVNCYGYQLSLGPA